MTTERTWEIEERIGGKMVKRTVTLAEYRAGIDRIKALGEPLMAAWRSGDIAAAERAQRDYRATRRAEGTM